MEESEESRQFALKAQSMEAERLALEMISLLQGNGSFVIHHKVDQRKLAIARTNLETGFLWLREAIATYRESYRTEKVTE